MDRVASSSTIQEVKILSGIGYETRNVKFVCLIWTTFNKYVWLGWSPYLSVFFGESKWGSLW